MELAVLKAIFDWVGRNREGFWQGLFFLCGIAALWALTKLVGRGKVLAGGVLDTYVKMTDDLKKSIADERDAMKARLDVAQAEAEAARKARLAAEDAAQKEHEARIVLLTQLNGIREALAREGEVAITNPDGTVSIKPAGSLPNLKDL